jgi:hypothetical protein
MLPPEEEEKKTEAAEKAEAAEKVPAEGEEISFRAQALVMWGNVLYEQSQVRHRTENLVSCQALANFPAYLDLKCIAYNTFIVSRKPRIPNCAPKP